MAKRNRSFKDASSTDRGTSPFNAAFAGLEGLKASLAPSEPPAPEAPAQDAVHHEQKLSSAVAYTLKGKVALHREKKGRAGKTVTRVSGLTLDIDELAALARDMKKQLGCGAVVEERDVVLLGDLGQRAADWLRARGAKRVVGDGIS
ncbi:MAG: translation initiation factor [Myxococcota bacterium]